MNRDDTFTFRTNSAERELIAAVARRLERTPSDAVRVVLREKARELGVMPANEERRPVDRAGVRV